jgi:hypothetical protein
MYEWSFLNLYVLIECFVNYNRVTLRDVVEDLDLLIGSPRLIGGPGF